MLSLVDGVCDHDLVQRTRVDAVNSISAENAVSNQRIDLRGALLLHQLGRTSDCVRCVCQVVDQDSSAVCNVTDEHHSRILSVADLCGAALLVDERKGHAQRVGDSSSALCTSSIRTDDDGLLVVGDVRLDVLAEEVTAVQVVDGNVEEALVLGVYLMSVQCSRQSYELPTVQVHGNDMVSAGACEEVGDQSTSLSNPLAISNLGLESRRLGGRLCDYAICAVCAVCAVKVHRGF